MPLFLIIIDGAVNDFTRSKGFFAEGTDLSAWDCLVGCSDSLTTLRGIFNVGRNKTNTDEIRMPYRNGILHGRDLNFGNQYVSCKCVALLFAVADWIQLKESEDDRQEKYKEDSNPSSFRELGQKIIKLNADKKSVSEWQPRKIQIGSDIPKSGNVDDYTEYPYLLPVVDVFAGWQTHNYGKLAQLLKRMFSFEQSDKKRAGVMEFKAFEILEVEERGCSMSRILVRSEWVKDSKEYVGTLEFGCAYQNQTGKAAYPWDNDGNWTIIPWNVRDLYQL